MPIRYKSYLTAIALISSYVMAQAAVTGMITLRRDTPPSIQVGKEPTCVELPRPPKGISFDGEVVPSIRWDGRSLCLEGGAETWGKKATIYLDYGEARYALSAFFSEAAPEGMLRARMEEPSPPPPPPPASSPKEEASRVEAKSTDLMGLQEVLERLGLLMGLLQLPKQDAPASSAPTPIPPSPPAPVPTTPAPLTGSKTEESANPTKSSPSLPSLVQIGEVAKPEEKPQQAFRPLMASLSLREGKLFLSFTLVNTEDYPLVVRKEDIKVEVNGRSATGEATLRYMSGVSGWVPPRSSVVGTIRLDAKPEAGRVRLLIGASLLDPTLSERTWSQEWTISFVPLIK